MADLELDDDAAAGDGAAWMATFADMMTLLLCFFILLLSFATMDVQKFRDAMGSIQEALGRGRISRGRGGTGRRRKRGRRRREPRRSRGARSRAGSSQCRSVTRDATPGNLGSSGD